jgi:hypothetical protein
VDVVPGAHGKFFREPNIQVLASTIRKRIEEAQVVDHQRLCSSAKEGYQRLSEGAYRTKLLVDGPLKAEPGESIKITVKLENTGSEIWQPSERSALYLANRWLDMKGRVINHLDGRAVLNGSLAPGEAVEISLTARAPAKAGRWIVELDMVDEGIAWFKELGSAPAKLQIEVGSHPESWQASLRFGKKQI